MSMFHFRISKRSAFKALSLAAMLVGGALALPQAGAAANAQGPFGKFSGNWRGAGRVTTGDGRSEAITCRATYEISQGGAGLSQTLVCASDSYRFDIRSTVVADGENVQGNWQETTRNVTGNLSGHVGNGVFEGNVDGPGFTADIVLRSSGKKQAVEISPHAGDITKVEVALTRGT